MSGRARRAREPPPTRGATGGQEATAGRYPGCNDQVSPMASQHPEGHPIQIDSSPGSHRQRVTPVMASLPWSRYVTQK